MAEESSPGLTDVKQSRAGIAQRPPEPPTTNWPELLRRRLPQYLAAAAACMGGFSLGCGLGWSGPCVEVLKSDYGFDVFSTNVIAAVFPLGAALAMTLVPFLIDTLGRKWTMMALVPPFVIGWCFVTFSQGIVWFLGIGRFITGACGGMFCVAAPMYSAEISEVQIRGTLGVFFQLLLVIGILYAYCTGYTKSLVWTSLLCGIAPLIFAAIMIFMPESPLFYMTKNRERDARKSMRFFRGPDFNIDPEIAAFKEQVEKSKGHKVHIQSFLKKPVLKTMGVAFGLMFAQQFSGINAIIFYSESIFKSTGIDMDSALQAVIFAVVQVIACVFSAILVDRLGRKLLMGISCGVMCICQVGLASFFIIRDKAPQHVPSVTWLPLTSACLYILAFCFGAGPIPWAYMGEIFPSTLKGAASSSAAFFNWMLAFIVTVSFSSAVEAVGAAPVQLFFAAICLWGVFFVIFFMIETRHKSFSDIQREFGTFDVEQD